jgi:hypothetical protein
MFILGRASVRAYINVIYDPELHTRDAVFRKLTVRAHLLFIKSGNSGRQKRLRIIDHRFRCDFPSSIRLFLERAFRFYAPTDFTY